ncbi:MAG: hypothetical protein JRE28_12240 [Deltaproteobacteria bacterium]|nr:hypothetical protein [Deltaproteobacteria bacterium]
MAKILLTLGGLSIALAICVVAYPFFVSSATFDPLINGLPAGILVAIGAQFLAQGKNMRDANEKRSLFYLESCVLAYTEASNILQDGNNERMKWIGAGRALGHAKELATMVTEDAHLRVLELHQLKYRSIFSDAIAERTAAFFYGSHDPSITTEEAAKLSTAREELSGRTVTSTLKELSDKSLLAVWEAAQWPTNYQDPLGRGFTEEERGKLIVLFPGLHEFLEHKERFHSASGKLFPRDADDTR